MTTTLKVVTGVTIIGLLIWGLKAAQDAFADFAYKIVGYGFPQFNTSSYQLSLPVKIRFKNPTPVSLDLDDVLIHVYLKKDNEFVHAGMVRQQNLSIEPGTAVKEVVPVVDLGNVFSGFLETIQNALRDRKVTLRTDVTVTYKGITLPTQSSTDDVTL